MFSEILRIKPLLDSAAAKVMEQNLTTRFARVSRRFGDGLKKAFKSFALGAGLSLITRLLNPIQALEERIKSLLGQGDDIRDVAEEFNTSPGQLKRLQDVAQSLGVQPDQLREMMQRYAQAVETARDELEVQRQTGGEVSQATEAVRNFVDEQDLAESFFRFIQNLQREGRGPGRAIPLSDGVTRQASGLETRQFFERAVFGERLTGARRRFVEADFAQQFQRIGDPSAAKLTQAVNKTADLADQQRILQTKNDTQDFLRGATNVTSKIIADMEAARAAEQSETTRRIQGYNDLRAASNELTKISNELTKLAEASVNGLGKLIPLVEKGIDLFQKSPLVRFFGGGR